MVCGLLSAGGLSFGEIVRRLLIIFLHRVDVANNGGAQKRGGDDCYFGAVFKDVHDEFAAVVERDAELVVAVV